MTRIFLLFFFLALIARAELYMAPVNSSVYLTNGNGHGSTNTKIRRWTNNTVTGSDMTYADSAANGMTVTINVAGTYAISYNDYYNLASADIGISVNSAELTTNIGTITAANRVAINQQPATNGAPVFVATTRYFNAGDVVRTHTSGLMNSTDVYSWFRITRVN